MGAPKIFENLIQAKRLHSLSTPAPRIQAIIKILPEMAPEASQEEKKDIGAAGSARIRAAVRLAERFQRASHGRESATVSSSVASSSGWPLGVRTSNILL
jgi:hypothetical protein